MSNTPRTDAAIIACVDAGGELGPEHRQLVELCRALESAAQPVAPAGWKWVPIEPTVEMEAEGAVATLGKFLNRGGPARHRKSDPLELEAANACYKAMLAAAPAAQPVAPDGWKPISIAPQDGTRIVLYRDGWAEYMCIGYWSKDFREWTEVGGTHFMEASQWMPLPAAPNAEAAQEGE